MSNLVERLAEATSNNMDTIKNSQAFHLVEQVQNKESEEMESTNSVEDVAEEESVEVIQEEALISTIEKAAKEIKESETAKPKAALLLQENIGISAMVSPESIKVLKLDVDPSVVPLTGLVQVDSKGRLGKLLDTILREVNKKTQLDLSVLPATVTSIPSWINPEGWTDFVEDDVRYFYKASNKEFRTNKFILEIRETLAEAGVYSVKLEEEFEYEGVKYTTKTLSPSELSHLYSLFSNYGAKLVKYMENGKEVTLFVVGDYV